MWREGREQPSALESTACADTARTVRARTRTQAGSNVQHGQAAQRSSETLTQECLLSGHLETARISKKENCDMKT